MPYINDYGARPWSEVINEVGGGIRGAIAQKQQRDDVEEQRGRAEAEQNRALHPATQKWAQKVLSGEMTAAQAAVAAHTEIDGMQGQAPTGGSPAPDPAMMSSGGKLGDTGQDQGMMPPAPQPQQGLRSAISEPERPFTVRDAQDLEKLAPVMAASQRRSGTGVSEADAEARIAAKGEQERKTLAEKEGGRNDRLGRTLTSRENTAEKTRQARAAEVIQKHDEKIATLNNALDIAIRHNESAEKVAAIRSEAQLIASDDSAVAKELSSIMRDDALDEDNRRHLADANNRRAELRARVGSALPVPSYGGGNAVQGPAAPGVPVPPVRGAPLQPDASTPEIPPVIPNLGVPPAQPGGKPLSVTKAVNEPAPGTTYGPPVSDPSALPARKDSTKGPRMVKMRFPSGNVHDVPADQADAVAKSKGAVIVSGVK